MGTRIHGDPMQAAIRRVLPYGGRLAFSLLDVLIAIAVMTMLIAILLPSLQGATEQARRVKCSSNVRQVGLALQMYVFDQNDQLPASVFDESTLSSQEMIFVRL